MANLLHFEYRVTLEGVADIFTNAYDIPLSAPTVQELCNRAVEKAAPVYEDISIKLQKSKTVNADETGSNQNGNGDFSRHCWHILYFFNNMAAILLKKF